MPDKKRKYNDILLLGAYCQFAEVKIYEYTTPKLVCVTNVQIVIVVFTVYALWYNLLHMGAINYQIIRRNTVSPYFMLFIVKKCNWLSLSLILHTWFNYISIWYQFCTIDTEVRRAQHWGCTEKKIVIISSPIIISKRSVGRGDQLPPLFPSNQTFTNQ